MVSFSPFECQDEYFLAFKFAHDVNMLPSSAYLCYIVSHLNVLMFFGSICIPFQYARWILRVSLGATIRLLHCDLKVLGSNPGTAG